MQISGVLSSQPAMNSTHLWIQQQSQHTSEIGHVTDQNTLPAANDRMLNTAKRTYMVPLPHTYLVTTQLQREQ